MNKASKFSLIYSKNHRYAEIFLFSGFSILIPLISDSYSFNPFLLVLIYLAYNRGINSYLFTVALTTLTAFFVSVGYGIELLILNGFFFLFCLIFCLIRKDLWIKRYGPFLFTHLLLMGIYLVRSFSFDNLLNLLISFSASCILLYGYNRLMKCLIEPGMEFEAKAKVVVLSTFSILFYGITGFYVLITRFVQILISKTASAVEGALSLLIGCLLLFYLQDISYPLLLTLLVPALLSVFLNKKYVWITYLASYVFLSVYLIDQFYTSVFFYQGLLGILLALIFPESWLERLTELFQREESRQILETNELINRTGESISNIINYLDVVLDSSIDTQISPADKTLGLIEEKVCKECERRGRCHLFSVIKRSLEGEFSKEDKGALFEECLYPYKIIRQIRLNKVTLENEKKYLDEIKNKNDMFKKEIENIYRPLRNVFSHSEILTRKRTQLLEELEAYSYNVSELSIGEDTVSFQIALDNKEDISKVMVIISNNMKKTYYLEDMFFILSLGMYQVTIASRPLYRIEEGIVSYGLNEEFNGDTYLTFYENNHYYLILSDGIGHSQNSAYLSFFMVNALNCYRKIENRVPEQISNINALLKSKIDEELYATLDYVDIDLIQGTMEIFKCGSFHSYLFRKNTLIKFKSNTPPLGILYEIKTASLSKNLEPDDILVFLSDGYLQEPEEIIENTLKENTRLTGPELSRLLDQNLSARQEVADDKTVIVLKFQTLKNFVKEEIKKPVNV